MSHAPQTSNEQNAPTAPLDIIPPEILELLGPPPLLPSEDAKAYYATLAFFARSIRPGEDLITWMLIKDLADHRAEIARYRRLKAALVVAAYRRSQKAFWRDLHERETITRFEFKDQEIHMAERMGKSEQEILDRTVEILKKFLSDLRKLRQDQRL